MLSLFVLGCPHIMLNNGHSIRLTKAFNLLAGLLACLNGKMVARKRSLLCRIVSYLHMFILNGIHLCDGHATHAEIIGITNSLDFA